MKDKSITLAEVTEILSDIEIVVSRGEQFMKKASRRMKSFSQTTKLPWLVTTSIINKKTYLMTFIAWAIILTDVIFGTFFDVLGKPLTSSFG